MLKTEKTIYDPKEAKDGVRVLVMRTWPRGISKSKVDLWAKEVGTPIPLIKQWKAGKITWPEFAAAYRESLKDEAEALDELVALAKKKTVTLLCSCKDPERCHRTLLARAIEQRLRRQKARDAAKKPVSRSTRTAHR